MGSVNVHLPVLLKLQKHCLQIIGNFQLRMTVSIIMGLSDRMPSLDPF